MLLDWVLLSLDHNTPTVNGADPALENGVSLLLFLSLSKM